ncbi:MAG TPA: nucleoside deaminase [Nitrososphaera sp.]
MARSKQISGAEKCVEIAVREAEKARISGTFGVGGLLIDNNTGTIVKVIRNRVIQNCSVRDPTAHVERQLVDWYYYSKNKNNLPSESMMTIVTSLDPCLMCAGSILTGGFNVIHVSRDELAGIGCRGQDFPTLPNRLRQKAKETFSAFGVVGKRTFSGPSDSIFYGSDIDSRFDQRSIRAFSSSLKKVKDIINCHGQPPSKLVNPRTLERSSHIFKLLKKYNPQVLSDEYVVAFDSPGIELGYILVEKASESYKVSGIFNSACIIDPFGNVLMAESGAQEKSPIRTPFMDLVRKYHKLIFDLGHEGRKYFAHTKYCKIVTMLGPGEDSKSLMELGCFGACIEGRLPEGSQLQYIIPQQRQQDLKRMLENLPPLFSTTVRLQDHIQQVEDEQLIKFCKSASVVS